jgi:hypothetical protein
VPVLVLPDKTTLQGITKVGLICDYSREVDYHTLEFLLALAKVLNLHIDVITLNRSEKIMTDHEMAYRKLVLKKLESITTTFSFKFNEIIHDGIIDYATANDIGLIAIMPKSYSFIERLFHESLTEKMTFNSPIPLLVLK